MVMLELLSHKAIIDYVFLQYTLDSDMCKWSSISQSIFWEQDSGIVVHGTFC